VALLGVYTPASITLQVIGVDKPPLHDKAAVLEEVYYRTHSEKSAAQIQITALMVAPKAFQQYEQILCFPLNLDCHFNGNYTSYINIKILSILTKQI
jgi:hypothetical protein